MSTRTIFLVLFLVGISIIVQAQVGYHFYGDTRHDYFQQLVPYGNDEFIALGTKSNSSGFGEIWLVHLNVAGSIISEWTISPQSGTAHWHGHRLIILSNGNFLIAGERRESTGARARTGLIMEVSTEGEILWFKTYSDIRCFYDILEVGEERIAVGMAADTRGFESAAMIRISSNGAVLKSNTFRVSDRTACKRVFILPDGDLLVVGRSYVVGVGFSGVFVRRFREGFAVWSSTWSTGFREADPNNGDFYIQGLGVTQDSDGSLWVVNPIITTTTYGHSLLHCSVDGEWLEKKHYYSDHPEYLYAMINDPEDSFILAGQIDEHGLGIGISPGGLELWKQNYVWGENEIRILDVQQVSDGFVFAGMFRIAKTNDFDGMFAHIRHDGTILPWHLSGQIVYAQQSDCEDSDTLPAEGWFLHFTQKGEVTPLVTDKDGRFDLFVNNGSASVAMSYYDTALWSACTQQYDLTFNAANPDQDVLFVVTPKVECEKLEVSLTQPDFELCDTTDVYVVIHNKSIVTSGSYFLKMDLGKGLHVVSCSEPYVEMNDELEILLDPVEFRQPKRVDFRYVLDCDHQLGATHELVARLEPFACDSVFAYPQYRITSSCSDGVVKFKLSNDGGTGQGDCYYRVFRNQALEMNNQPVDLHEPGSAYTIEFPSNGETWRVELVTDEAFSWVQDISAEFEGCGQGSNGLYDIQYSGMRSFGARNSFQSRITGFNTTGVPNAIQNCTNGIGSYNLLNELSSIEFSARVRNDTQGPVSCAEFLFDFSDALDLTTFEVLAANGQVEYGVHDKKILASLTDLNLAPGMSAMIRFRVSPRQGILPDQGYGSFLGVDGDAFLDGFGPIVLQSALMNYSSIGVGPTDPYNTYSKAFELYGGKYREFAGEIELSKDGNHLFLAGSSYSYSNNNSSDGYVLRTDLEGKVEWLSVFDHHLGTEQFEDIAATRDGGCLVVGQRKDAELQSELNNYYAALVRLDSYGRVVSDTIFRPTGYGCWVSGIEPLSDSTFLLFGYAYAPQLGHFYTKLDDRGNVLWTKSHAYADRAYEPVDVLPLDDGSFITVCNIWPGSSVFGDMYVERLNEFGEVMWGEVISNASHADPVAVVERDQTTVFVLADDGLTAIHKNGGVVWSSVIDIPDSWSTRNTRAMIKGNDGFFYITGMAGIDTYAKFEDAILLKVNSDGELVWSREFGAANSEDGRDLVVLPDGRIRIWGNNQARPPLYNLQSFLIKTDEDGMLSTGVQQNATGSVQPLIFPNPAHDIIHLVFEEVQHSDIMWQLGTIEGVKVLSGRARNTGIEIPVSGLDSGIYVISFPQSHISTSRICIVH